MHIKLFTLSLDTKKANRLDAVKAADMCGFGRNQIMTSLIGQELKRAYKV